VHGALIVGEGDGVGGERRRSAGGRQGVRVGRGGQADKWAAVDVAVHFGRDLRSEEAGRDASGVRGHVVRVAEDERVAAVN
jgi:hypothetical protein